MVNLYGLEAPSTDSKLLVLLLKYISETNVNEDKQLAELTSTNHVNLSPGRTAFLRKERKESGCMPLVS